MPIFTLHTPDEARRGELFPMLADAGVLQALLYESGEPGLEEWLEATSPKNCWCAEARIDDEVAALVWVNGFSGKAAFMHFAFLPVAKPHLTAVTRKLCAWAFSGGLSAIIGVTPAVYRHVFPVLRLCGFIEQMRVPGGSFIARRNRHVDAVVNMLTQERFEQLEKEWNT